MSSAIPHPVPSNLLRITELRSYVSKSIRHAWVQMIEAGQTVRFAIT
jgi:aspartate carbamoyltransferase catalytic subunit